MKNPQDTPESNQSQSEQFSEGTDSPNPVVRGDKFSIQDYLSLGYLYLLCLGIITEVVYYKILGINILYYSSLIDVLLSPVVFMTRRLAVFVTLIVVVATVWLLDKHLSKKSDRDSNLNQSDQGKKKTKPHPKDFFVKITMVAVFFMFIGGGAGAGMSQREAIMSGEFSCRDEIQFVNKDAKTVRIVGQNTNWVFYVEPDSSVVIASPIEGNIESISSAEPTSDSDQEKE